MPNARQFIGTALMAMMPLIAGCVPAALVAGAAVGVMSAHDRRSTGSQTDDEVSEWKGSNRMPVQYANTAHVNFTAFNRILLVTGEVPGEEARRVIGEMASKVEGMRTVYNELVIAPVSSLSSRGNDALISSTFKARLLESSQLSANHIKPLTENGVLFLMGLVNEREARVAISIARTTNGVREVVNVMEVISEAETRRIDAMLPGSARKPQSLRSAVETP